MNRLDERIRVAAGAVDALRHAMAGPLQTATNTIFVLRKQVDPALAARLVTVEEQLLALTDRLAEFSGLTEAMRPPHRQKVALSELAACALSHLGQPRRVEISAAAGEAWVDVGQLALALAELLENALELTPGAVALKLSRAGATLSACVSDSGGGRWPEPVDAAKDPMYSTRGRSLGLGLAIAHAAAAGHGGSLSIRPGEHGSSVELLVPCEEPA